MMLFNFFLRAPWYHPGGPHGHMMWGTGVASAHSALCSQGLSYFPCTIMLLLISDF